MSNVPPVPETIKCDPKATKTCPHSKYQQIFVVEIVGYNNKL